MTRAPLLWRMVGGLAVSVGYAVARTRAAAAALDGALRPTRGWRQIELGDIRLHVPPDWGAVEPDPPDGFVIHNRLRHARVDGDAVWYASAVELRIRKGNAPARDTGEAMAVSTRVLSGPGEAVTLSLAVANGISPRLRRTAERVLVSAVMRRGGGRLAWPAARDAADERLALAHARVAVAPAAGRRPGQDPPPRTTVNPLRSGARIAMRSRRQSP